MTRKILIIKEEESVCTYFIEDGEIVEIHPGSRQDPDGQQAALGNMYIGKVQNIVANIGAAFIDIGGISCYYDISQVPHAIFTNKMGKIKK